MPATLRPDRVDFEASSPVVPEDTQYYTSIAQPVPSADQSCTVIQASGWVTCDDDSDGGTAIFRCYDASLPGGTLTTGTRQIGGDITLTIPAIAAAAGDIATPFVVRWIDTAPLQSGMYVVVYADADIDDIILSGDPNPPQITTVGS